MNLCTRSQWPAILEKYLSDSKNPLIVVLGPTASGKTAFSIELAKHVAGMGVRNAEIVNADSRQLYRFLDIGTAKVTDQEKDGVPHHLLDMLDPEQEVTIAWYKEAAEHAIAEIHARGNVPILVGGSMLYISALIDGLEPLASDPALRARLEAEYDADGGKALYARLQEIDPETASAFHPNNKPYVIRAMEIFETTGEAPSQAKKQSSSPYDLLLFGMYWERKALTERIEGRTGLLLKGGWIEEIQKLRAMGYGPQTPAMKSHGYREILERIERVAGSEERVADLVHDPELIKAINAKTRQYAKRQVTWWKHDPRIYWISMG